MLSDPINNKTIYLNIAYGLLNEYKGKGNPEVPHGSVEGIITSIKTVSKTINRGTTVYLYINMKDGDENYLVQVPMYKSAGPNIIRSLKNALDKGILLGANVKIRPYQKEREGLKFTNATLYIGDQKLDWADIPSGVEINDAIYAMEQELERAFSGEVVDDMPPGDGEDHNPFAGFSE